MNYRFFARFCDMDFSFLKDFSCLEFHRQSLALPALDIKDFLYFSKNILKANVLRD